MTRQVCTHNHGCLYIPLTHLAAGQIQHTIREEFAGSIVITIAHRLKTVLDCDRVLVLGNGEILEFDTPEALIGKP